MLKTTHMLTSLIGRIVQKTKLLIVGSLLILLAGCVQKPNLNGFWRDDSKPPFKNCYACYAVDGNTLQMMHFFQYGKKPFFETGIGTVEETPEGLVLKYDVVVRQTVDDWATKGYHELTLSKDGKVLEGFYISEKGARGKLKFIKRDAPVPQTGE
jgi:hypothetical protein